jgi:hypothetical protein
MMSLPYSLRRGALAVLLLAVVATVTLPAYSVTKVGTTSMQVLKIPMGVRGIALANAMAATAHTAEAVWWNPGALTEMRGTQAYLTQINMPANIHLNSVVLARRLDSYSAASLHAINLATDDMPIRTWERPLGTGENFAASDLAVGASYARRLTDRFSLGGNVRYLHSALDADAVYNGVSVDLGTLYTTGLRTLRLGMAIQNLGPNVKYSGTFLDYRNRVTNEGQLVSEKFQDASLPTMFRLGVAFDPFIMFGIPMDSAYSSEVSVEMNHPNDNRERLNLGGELGFRNALFLRVGGKFAYDEESVAAGFGLRIPVFAEYHLRFDYAYSYQGRITTAGDGFLDQPHRFALGFEW